MPLKGKNTKVLVGTTDAGPFAEVDELDSASMNNAGNNQDISKFGVDFIRRLQGLKDASYSLGGRYEPTDADGQVVVRDAWLNDTLLYFQFLPDGANGFQQEVKVASFDIESAVDGPVGVSIELEGTDPITIVAP